MKYIPILVTAVLLSACSSAPPAREASLADTVARSQASPPRFASLDTIAQFLIASAAADFHAHRPPDPARFRDVRIGHITAPNGDVTHLMCGEFLSAEDGGKAGWMSFVTIKTSGYEQWLGAQAQTFCRDESVVWDKTGDVSSVLQSRLDALR